MCIRCAVWGEAPSSESEWFVHNTDSFEEIRFGSIWLIPLWLCLYLFVIIFTLGHLTAQCRSGLEGHCCFSCQSHTCLIRSSTCTLCLMTFTLRQCWYYFISSVLSLCRAVTVFCCNSHTHTHTREHINACISAHSAAAVSYQSSVCGSFAHWGVKLKSCLSCWTNSSRSLRPAELRDVSRRGRLNTLHQERLHYWTYFIESISLC